MYWRRKLPHWVPEDSIVFVTWRLAGSQPRRQAEIITNNPGLTFLLDDRALDRAATGPRSLLDPRIADIVARALQYGESDKRFYNLYAWVVMPNHVHAVFEPLVPLSEIMQWLKGRTAAYANRVLGRTGVAFWQIEWYDRWIRSAKELGCVMDYVERNPMTAGLVDSPDQWRWSSAFGPDGKTVWATL